MAVASQSVMAMSSCVHTSHGFLRNVRRRNPRLILSATADSPTTEDSDCNDEECAPDKEVGKVSGEWLAGEKTKVVGTFPPRKKGWTGYVEKDTAGQTNIYSVEPVVYVAESAISSGSAGSSSEGSENTAAVAAGLALISIAAASVILLQVGKNAPQIQTVEYTGPPLSYYINKFKPVNIVEASAPIELQDDSLPLQTEKSQKEAPEVQVELIVNDPPESPQVQVELSDQVEQIQNPSE